MSAHPGESDPPELSVVIPAYDAESTLGVQLGALLAQRPAWPWEVIVSDNGSNDGTRRLVQEWTARMPELRLVDASARRGPSAARNIAVAQARASALAFCDADDMVADGWVEAVHRALGEHEFVAGPFEGARLNSDLKSSVTWTAQTDRLTVKPGLEQFVTAGSGNMGVRKAVFDEVGGFFEGARTAEDDDFCIRVQLAGHDLVFVPDVVLHVRRRDGLRNIARQSFAYGAGERWLSLRYSLLLGDASSEPSDPSSSDADAAPAAGDAPSTRARGGGAADRLAALVRRGRTIVVRGVGFVGKAFRKASTVRRPGDLSDLVWRLSWSAGWRFGHVPPAPPIVPPAHWNGGRS
ncbi:glycosyltransferase [Oerskovia enterophila]|uniref:UDP-Glc:alpha-D-GlcNAc-diphosphoundecaprenol beta-1,3-glucosyltransferase WfgD n=1 Tax=Oerskovia enterophila TaxID=43678 RepID=A0A163S3U1_9CELL|nr:glycosyltransferase [Oerskovia enterophila]KZM35986.1 UDP-Glc:alpha-D-GlcNAc-diphosphoundecaprenol beta-1,3-glucosyltransferase WfgD [Oerskovia enterophila]